jgi:hypothetical protein
MSQDNSSKNGKAFDLESKAFLFSDSQCMSMQKLQQAAKILRMKVTQRAEAKDRSKGPKQRAQAKRLSRKFAQHFANFPKRFA